MDTKRINVEHLLYTLAFGVALCLRLLNLGAAPLSDYEASWALQAIDIAQGASVRIGPQPGYVILTGGLFFLFEASNTWARFWPALAGSLLIWSPYFFRHRLGRAAALIMAFGLAVDPGMVALSRLAGGPMLGIAFGSLALACLFTRRSMWTGIFTGLALLGGPSLWIGLVGLLIAWGVGRFLRILPPLGNSEIIDPLHDPSAAPKFSLKIFSFAGLGTVLLVGTAFFRYPGGLGALAAGLPEYLGGWLESSGTPALQTLAALVFYQPLAVIFGIIAVVRGWVKGAQLERWFSLFALIVTLTVTVYPGREVWDMAWVVIILWALSGLELSRYREVQHFKLVALGQAVMIVVLLVLVWLNLAGLTFSVSEVVVFRWGVMLAAFVMGALATTLIALGWSWPLARNGLVWGTAAGLGFYIMSTVIGVSQLRPNGVHELWTPAPATGQTQLLVGTLNDLAISQTGRGDMIDVISLVDSPSLEWALRDFSQTRFVPALEKDLLPSVVITSQEDTSLDQTSAYRGQDFRWRETPGWDGALPGDWTRWLVFRDAPSRTENIILWARADFFPEDPVAVQENIDEAVEDEGEIE